MTRPASLPMYDLPELGAATDAWWAGLARHLRSQGLADVPDRLDRGTEGPALWRSPDLLLSQTCGYPLMTGLVGTVRVIATPTYAVANCAPGEYCSRILVREDEPARDLAELRGRVAAVNSRDSQSGYNVLRYMVATLAEGRPFFAQVVESGSHAASLAAVAAGTADLAACDAVTFQLLARCRPQALAGLRVLADTPAAPGLPYVTSVATSQEDLRRLRDGLAAANADPALAAAREALLLRGFEILPETVYDRVTAMETEAKALNYPDLR